MRAVERGEIEARREARGGAEHHIALAGVVPPPGSAPGAPMIRSSMPSPLTSPAPATETAAVVIRRRSRRGGSRCCRRARRDRGSPRSPRRSRTPRSSRRRCTCRRDRRRRPDDQVIDAVAVDVPRARDREAAVVIVVDPVEAEAVGAVERGEIEARREARGGAEHHVALAGVVPAAGIGAGAPMIRSSMPSPLTSPAPATEKPLWSYVVDPVEAEAVAAVERGEIEARRRSPRRCRTPRSSRRRRTCRRDRRTGPR